MVVLKLLQAWGRKGFFTHTQHAAAFYRERRDLMAQALDKHFVNVRYTLPSSAEEGPSRKPIAEWIVPDASMFFWVKLYLPTETHLDITTFVRNTAVPNGILVLPGSAAFPEERRTGCVRLSFSLLSDEEMEEGVKRLANAVMSLLPQEKRASVDRSVTRIDEEGPQDVEVCENGEKIRDSGVCITEVPTEEDTEDLVVYPRVGEEPTAKPLPLPPSSFSNHSSESSTTVYAVKTASLASKRASAPGDQSSKRVFPNESSVAFPSSPRAPSDDRDQVDDSVAPTRRFTMRLRRASSTIGLKLKSLTRTPSTVRLTEGALKIRASVAGLRERARRRGPTSGEVL
jgi:hypothetical protein